MTITPRLVILSYCSVIRLESLVCSASNNLCPPLNLSPAAAAKNQSKYRFSKKPPTPLISTGVRVSCLFFITAHRVTFQATVYLYGRIPEGLGERFKHTDKKEISILIFAVKEDSHLIDSSF